MALRKVLDVNQISAPMMEVWIDDNPVKPRVHLVQGGQTVEMDQDRVEAILGAVYYAMGELNSTPV